MSDIEDRVRAELRSQAQRIQPHHLSELRVPARRAPARRGRARRWLAPAAALVAVGLVATVIGVVAGERPGSGPASTSPSGTASPARSRPSPSVSPSSPSPTSPAAAAMPPFYVTTGDGQSTRLIVRASGNGAVLDSLTALPDVPGGVPDDPNPVVVGLVAAAADDRTFVISFHRQQVDPTSATITWFYRLTLTPDETLTGLQKLPLTVQPGVPRYQADAMALSPDGGTLAVAVGVAPGYQARQPAIGHAALEVVSLRTGRVRTWTAPPSADLRDLSWGPGATLGFSSGSARPGASPGYQVRVLDTAGPTGDLMGRSRPVALATSGRILSALVTGNGRLVVAFTGALPGGVVLAEYSAQTGQRLRVLETLRGDAKVGGTGTVWSADPTGQHLLIGGVEATGRVAPAAEYREVFGRVDDGRFTPLPDPAALQPQSGAW